jgi:hypothetical protein
MCYFSPHTRKGLSVKENMPVSYFQRRAARRLATSRRRWYNAGKSPYVHQKKECSFFGCVPFLFGIREGTRTRKGLSVKENMPVSYFQRRAARRLAASRRRWYNAGKSPYVYHTETRMGAGFFQYPCGFVFCTDCVYDKITTVLRQCSERAGRILCLF